MIAVSAGSELARLQEIVERSGVPGKIEALLPLGARPRQLRVATLLLGMLLVLSDGRPAHLRRVHQALIGLSEKDKRRLGVIASWKQGEHLLTYRQTERTFSLVVKALSKQKPDGRPAQTLCEMMDALIEASVTVLGRPPSQTLAIDWTDYESFARPPRKARARSKDAAQQAEPQEGEDEDRKASCADPEAAWGHRKTNHPGTGKPFYGYYLQAATIVKEEGRPEVPELVRRIQIASPRHDPPATIVPVIERMTKDGIALGDLLCDCGYSYREPETFALPMRAAGAKLIMDLHPNDRGCKGTHQGAICANGNLYCAAIPEALHSLGPLAPGASAEQQAAHDAKAAELHRYKLSPISSPNPDGYHRACCPAVKGKIRCPLRPASMALSHEHPTITSPPEHPPSCCVQQTITVPAAVNAKTKAEAQLALSSAPALLRAPHRLRAQLLPGQGPGHKRHQTRLVPAHGPCAERALSLLRLRGLQRAHRGRLRRTLRRGAAPPRPRAPATHATKAQAHAPRPYGRRRQRAADDRRLNAITNKTTTAKAR